MLKSTSNTRCLLKINKFLPTEKKMWVLFSYGLLLSRWEKKNGKVPLIIGLSIFLLQKFATSSRKLVELGASQSLARHRAHSPRHKDWISSKVFQARFETVGSCGGSSRLPPEEFDSPLKGEPVEQRRRSPCNSARTGGPSTGWLLKLPPAAANFDCWRPAHLPSHYLSNHRISLLPLSLILSGGTCYRTVAYYAICNSENWIKIIWGTSKHKTFDFNAFVIKINAARHRLRELCRSVIISNTDSLLVNVTIEYT